MRHARGERIARAFIDLETPRFEAVTGSFPTRMPSSASAPSASRRPSCRRFRRRSRSERRAHRLDGGPAARAGRHAIARSSSSARFSTGRGSATPISSKRRRPRTESFFAPIATYRGRSANADLRARRAAVHHRALRTRPPRAVARRQPVGRRRQGDGPGRARAARRRNIPESPQRITPQLLSVYFRYIRNLSLIDRRLTPDLYTLVVAAQQTAGDDFALALAETARTYPLRPTSPTKAPATIRRAGPGADGDQSGRAARSGAPGRWSAGCRARRSRGASASCGPAPEQGRTDPLARSAGTRSACARGRPRTTGSRASTATSAIRPRPILGADLARTEKFTTSVRDGIDIRETLRNWHTGDLYVKVVPAEPRLDRGRRLPLRRAGRPRRSTPTARPGTPSTPRNRRWPSTPPTP